MAIKRMTLEEVRNLPPLTEKELKIIRNAKAIPTDDCPELTEEQLAKAKPVYLVHPEWFTPKKSDVHIKIDTDILNAFKSKGRGYQTRINAVLRQAVANGNY